MTFYAQTETELVIYTEIVTVQVIVVSVFHLNADIENVVRFYRLFSKVKDVEIDIKSITIQFLDRSAIQVQMIVLILIQFFFYI